MAKRWFPRTEAALLDDQEPAEQARRFAAMWVRKEACVKAAGGRLVQGLRLPVTAGPLVGDPSGVLPGPWRVRDLAGDLAGPLDGYAAALAVAGERPYRTEIRDWTVGPDLPPGFRAST
jgi:4'-phosphopantetheinyl transferase